MSRDITSHVKSKSDLHFILSIEGKFNIPHLDNCSMFWMKEVLAGRKKVLKLADVRPIICPRLKEFSADRLYQMSMEDDVLSVYLPDPNEQLKRPVTRQFLFNVSTPSLLTHLNAQVVNTLKPSFFEDEISAAYDSRLDRKAIIKD